MAQGLGMFFLIVSNISNCFHPLRTLSLGGWIVYLEQWKKFFFIYQRDRVMVVMEIRCHQVCHHLSLVLVRGCHQHITQ